MAQKLGIVILLFILATVSAVIYWHLKFNRPALSPDANPNQPLNSTTQSSNAVTPASGDYSQSSESAPAKPMPSEEAISEQVDQVLEKIKVEGTTRRLTTAELMYLNNPRQAAIQDLTK